MRLVRSVAADQEEQHPTTGQGQPGIGRLLTVDEAAAFLNVPVRFVRRIVCERRVPVVRLGRHVRLAVSDLEAFVVAGRSTASPPEPTSAGRSA